MKCHNGGFAEMSQIIRIQRHGVLTDVNEVPWRSVEMNTECDACVHEYFPCCSRNENMESSIMHWFKRRPWCRYWVGWKSGCAYSVAICSVTYINIQSFILVEKMFETYSTSVSCMMILLETISQWFHWEIPLRFAFAQYAMGFSHCQQAGTMQHAAGILLHANDHNGEHQWNDLGWLSCVNLCVRV